MKKQSRPKANPGSLHKLDDDSGDDLLQLPDYLNPSPHNMFRSPSKVRMPNGAYGPEQFHIKDERERQEVARLRRLADVRAAVYSNRPSMPPRPQGSASSTPSLHHDFATKTHMARLDVAYEKLDAYVEKSVEQLIAAMKEQRQGLEERMDSRLEAFDERISLVVNTANETRSALDAAIGDLARSRHSGEQRDEEAVAVDAEMHAKLSACQERLDKLETAASQAAEADAEARHSETRVKSVEERIQRLEIAAAEAEGKTRAALDAAIGDVVRESKEKEATVELQAKVSDSRAESVQAMLADLSAKMEAEQLRTKIFDSRVEGLQAAVGELGGRFEEARTGGGLQPIVSELSSRLEAEQARTMMRLDTLQDQLVGTMAISGRISVLEERVTAIGNSANEARTNAGDVRTALDKAVHDLSGQLATRSTAAETASADTIAKAVDDRIACIDSLRTAMTEMVTRLEEEQARTWKRIDEVQEHAVSKSYIDERLNVIEWIKAEQLRGSKRLDEMFEQFVSKAYIDERLHGSDARLQHLESGQQHLESVRQQENAALLAAPGRSDYDDVCRRLDTVEKTSTDVQELRWRQEAFTSNLDMLARRLQEMIDQNTAADIRMQEATAREAAAKEAAATEAAAKEALTREAAANEAAAKEAAAREAAVKEAAAREAAANEAATKEAAAKEAALKEAAAREAAAKEAATKEAAAKEAAVKEAEAVSDLMRECVDGLDNKITDILQRLDVCAPMEVVNQLGAKMDGGFDAIVVQMETSQWMMTKTSEAADQIMQAFVLNVDERLHQCEDVVSKHSEFLKKHYKDEKSHSSRHGHSHGHHTSRSRSGKHVNRAATKEAIAKAEQAIVSFWFDVWARGHDHNQHSSSASSNVPRGA